VPCLRSKRTTEELRTSHHHGQPVVDAMVHSGGITANIFVFPRCVAEVGCVFL